MTHHTDAERRAPAAPVPQGWKDVAELCAQMCDSRAKSLAGDAHIAAASEARKCASVLRNPPDYWREKLQAAAPQPPEAATVELPEYGIDTANHAGIRVRGYTEQQVRELLAAHGIT